MKNNVEKYDAILNPSQQKYEHIYLSILKTGKKYDYLQKSKIEYDYSYNEDEIEKLKEVYDIDSLKGENEFETFLNATNWVSTILVSNGLPKGPSENSIKIIKNVKEGKNAANCYAHAVVLNDVLCALGYMCKYVFCYPIDLHPFDCHVVNLVYSTEHKKWVMLDSANNIFFSDKQEKLLNIEELRNCLVENKEIEVNLLNLYHNIKHRNRVFIKQKILIYMTKNMYRFGCYKNSQRDAKAQNTSIDFYHLVPKSFMGTPCCLTEYDYDNRVKRTEHYTLNPQLFWQTPEKM